VRAAGGFRKRAQSAGIALDRSCAGVERTRAAVDSNADCAEAVQSKRVQFGGIMKSEPSVLRDFTVDGRVWLLSGLAVVIGVGATFLAVILLRLISFFTNLFYYHRFSFAAASPAGSSLGYWMVAVPVIGGIVVGLMARFGSDKIRGHGIPEAIEAILLNRARVAPKIAILKPISAAIAIGSGGHLGRRVRSL